jgi:RES domain-containing protein
METAWLEAQQGFAFKPQPLTVCAYDVDSDPIHDLTDPNTLKSLGVTIAELACPWEDLVERGETPPTWTLARKRLAEGANGVLVPSFAPGATPADVNLVFWRWSDAPPDQVVLINDERRLPRDDTSWR